MMQTQKNLHLQHVGYYKIVMHKKKTIPSVIKRYMYKNLIAERRGKRGAGGEARIARRGEAKG